MRKLYKVSEVAIFLRLSKASTYNLIKTENISIYRISDRGIRISEDELERLLDKFRQSSIKEEKPKAPDDRDSLN